MSSKAPIEYMRFLGKEEDGELFAKIELKLLYHAPQFLWVPAHWLPEDIEPGELLRFERRDE